MHSSISFLALVSLVESQSLVLEAQDGTCGYLNGVKLASYGCQATAQKCAVYYPTSSLAGDSVTDTSVASTESTTLSFKTLAPRAAGIDTAAITPAPQVDYPAVVCCDPSKGACTAQPTACVDAFEHPYSALCTGNCPDDPMTLKCTAGHTLHCNQIEFQSPLYYQRNTGPNEVFTALEAGMGVAGGPGRGWFCGASALPTKLIETTIISRRPVVGDVSSPPTPSAMAPSSKQLGAPGSVVPVMNPGAPAGPQPGSNPGGVDNGVIPPDDYGYVPDAATGDDCCVDGPSNSKECCTEDLTRRARRLHRRKDSEMHNVGITSLTTIVTSPNQIRLATTTATPAAAPRMIITEGLAVVSTTYDGQNDRFPFSEASRSWNILVPSPTLGATTTSDRSTGHRGPGWPTMNPKDDLEALHIGRIVGAALGGSIALGLLVFIAIKCNQRRKADPRRLSDNKDKGVDNNTRISGASSPLTKWLLQKYLAERDGRLSSPQSQSSKLSTPNIPPEWLGPNNIPRRDNTSSRGHVLQTSRPPRAQHASPLPGDSADDEADDRGGTSPDSGPYYNATSTPKKDATVQVKPVNFSRLRYL